MKALILFTTLLLCTCPLLQGQSSFALGNYDPPVVNAPIFNADGTPLRGSNFEAELWGSNIPDSLAPAQSLRTRQRFIVPFASRGYFVGNGDEMLIPAATPGGYAWLQVRAWDARLGATYEEVMALGIGGYGESPLFYAQGSNPFKTLPEAPAPLIGLGSFSLRPVVPEPGTWVLLTLGGLGLLTSARRKK